MNATSTSKQTRKRAPSKRALETRARILDASEKLFAVNGYDGTSLRDIANEASVPVGLVHHHGVSKDALFHTTVARRANELSDARMTALRALQRENGATLEKIIEAFFAPFLRLARSGDQWLAYARLVAHVSVDPRWRHICAECFDPTADAFLDAIAEALPDTPRPVLAQSFVYSVSALLAHLTTRWRMETLGGSLDIEDALQTRLVAYCAAGLRAMTIEPPI